MIRSIIAIIAFFFLISSGIMMGGEISSFIDIPSVIITVGRGARPCANQLLRCRPTCCDWDRLWEFRSGSRRECSCSTGPSGSR